MKTKTELTPQIAGMYLGCEVDEIWKPVKDYEGLYEASNFGRIKSLNRIVNGRYDKVVKKGKILNQDIDKTGVVRVGLTKNFKTKTLNSHRLTAKAFIPNPLNKPEINHLDGNRRNNYIGNLEWCTRSENMKHAYRTGLKKPNILTKQQIKKLTKLCSIKVKVVDTETNKTKLFNSYTKCADFYNVTVSAISHSIIRGGIFQNKYKLYDHYQIRSHYQKKNRLAC